MIDDHQPTKWITFDCYGTLIDWRQGMEDALELVAPQRVQALLDAYHQHEHHVQAATPHPSYRHVLTESMRLAAADLDIAVPQEFAAVLADTLPTWPAFPETQQTLEALHADGWKLGILSNVDDDLIAPTLGLLGEPVDVVVTAEQVGSYKPGMPHFQEFARRANTGNSPWIHVACSWFHDVEPCNALGIPAVFINREHEMRDTGTAAAVRTDLTDLPEVVDEVLRLQNDGRLPSGNVS